jgi:hypothetical protein
MKKVILFAIALITFCESCSLTSVTTIDSKKSFVLGEGNHGSFSAKVVNKGSYPVEVFSIMIGEKMKSLGVLDAGAEGKYNVPSNTQVIFKNLGADKVDVALYVSGDTQLSMGYKDNKRK